ncbi:Transcription factor SPT8 [Candida viswanathii]|uniref:Transcription factor SPT8 n=1 Tax=Candida viswanathii TaxID=5486 RepID=A0A367YFY2_9ASCO|nr:Transcription factor SPT8 [Candida viswanathii]
MASIEQDDLFNVEDEEDMEDEELDVPQQEDYAMDIDEQQPKEEDNQDEDEEMIEGEYDEDQEGEEDEEDDEDDDEGEDEEEEEGEGEGEGEGEEEEDEDEEDEDDEEEEDEEEGDQSTANVSTAITSPRSKEQDDSKLLPEEPERQDQLPSTLIEENKDLEGDILLGQEAKEDSQRPESQPVEPEPKPQEPEKPQEKQPEEKKDDKEQPVELAQQQPPLEDKEKQPAEPSQDDKPAPELPQPPSQAAPAQVQPQPPTTEEAKDKEHLIDDIKDSESDLTFRERIIAKARRATEFDIIPQVAIPYTSQCHSLAFTEGPKWILTGGEDGFIRKYDFIASIQGKSPLTMAQKHNLLSDSLTNAGVICSYWENEQPLTRKQLMKQNPKLKDSDFSTGSVSYEPKVNPVYALDAERNGYWCLSGLLSGGISLYTMRYNEGTIHHYFHHGSKENRSRGHNDAVSVLKLNQEQDKFLSGSWDKTIREWDLNTGKTVIEYAGSSGQISNILFRPNGLSDITFTVQEPEQPPPQSQGNKDNNDDIDSLFGSDDEDQDMDDKTTEDDRKAKESASTATTHTKPGASSTTHRNSNIFMSSSIDGTINIWDVRTANPVIRLGVSEGTPPWCMSLSWSNNGDFIYAGRRNSTIEEISIKMPHTRSNAGHHTETMAPNVSKLLAFPKISGPVSALSTMPNDDFLLCGSNDNIRLYNLKLYDDLNNEKFNVKKQATPFLIIPGHHGGMLSSLYVDETGRFMVSASGYRGWGHGAFTDSVLIYEIDFE